MALELSHWDFTSQLVVDSVHAGSLDGDGPLLVGNLAHKLQLLQRLVALLMRVDERDAALFGGMHECVWRTDQVVLLGRNALFSGGVLASLLHGHLFNHV